LAFPVNLDAVSRVLVASDNPKQPTQWSHDGRFIVYSEFDPKTRRDIWMLPMDGAKKGNPVPFLRSEFNEYQGQLSPDSHWMAYTSDATGQSEVYCGRFLTAKAKRRFQSQEASSRAGAATERSCFSWGQTGK
jgi:Tol biopolymer transport system component